MKCPISVHKSSLSHTRKSVVNLQKVFLYRVLCFIFLFSGLMFACSVQPVEEVASLEPDPVGENCPNLHELRSFLLSQLKVSKTRSVVLLVTQIFKTLITRSIIKINIRLFTLIFGLTNIVRLICRLLF